MVHGRAQPSRSVHNIQTKQIIFTKEPQVLSCGSFDLQYIDLIRELEITTLAKQLFLYQLELIIAGKYLITQTVLITQVVTNITIWVILFGFTIST
jgi:hypothetical protein